MTFVTWPGDRRRLAASILAALLLLIALAACGGDEETPAGATSAAPNAEPSPTPDPAAIMSRAADIMTELESAAFEITRNGGPAYIDAGQTLNFTSASGVFGSPHSIDGTLAVAASGAALEIGFVSVGDNQYITNPLNQQWEQLPADWGFDPAALFDPETGWRPLLQQDLSDAQLLGISAFGGVERYRITAIAAGARVEAILGGLAGNDAVEIEFFVDTASNEIVQMSFMTDSAGEEQAEWLLRFFDFNEPVTINEPQIGG